LNLHDIKGNPVSEQSGSGLYVIFVIAQEEDPRLPQGTHLAIAGCQKVGIGISGLFLSIKDAFAWDFYMMQDK